MPSLAKDVFQILPKNKQPLFIISIILTSLIATSYNVVPLLFYRPQFQCFNKQLGVHQDCPQEQACKEQNLKYYSEYSFTSISLDYELFCGNKIVETKILTYMMVGHLSGAIFDLFIASLGNNLTKILCILAVSSGAIGMSMLSLIFFKGVTSLSVTLLIWTFAKEPILCFINILPGVAFSECKQKALGIIMTCWPILSIFLPFLFWILKDWRLVLVLIIGIPHIIISIILLKKFRQFSCAQEQSINTLMLKYVQQPLQQNSHLNWCNLKNNPYFVNLLMFLIFFGAGYVSFVTSTLYMNTVSGNLYINLSIANIFQLVANIIGMYASDNFNKGKLLIWMYLLIALSYFAYQFCDQLFQSSIIILGKILTDLLWILLGQFLYTILPKNMIPFAQAGKSCFSMFLISVLPYLKYGMQSIQLSLFPASGVYYILAIASYFFIKPISNSKELIMIQMV